MKKYFLLPLILVIAAACAKTAPQSIKSVPAPQLVFQPEAKMLPPSFDPKPNAGKPAAVKSAVKINSDNAAQNIKAVDTATGDPSGYVYPKFNCQQGSPDDRFNCLDGYYRGLISKFGIDTAFKDIKQRYNEDPFVVAECHPLMHVIGQEASKAYPTVSEAYLHGDNFCWSGYYHGIMEGVIAKIGIKNLPAQLDGICANIPGKQTYNFNYYNCVHGLGHGIMEINQDELFVSLQLCDNLVGSWEQLSCYSGVFMENVIADGKNHSSKYLKADQPMYPCNVVDEKYKSQCYLGQTSFALQATGYDFPKVFSLCTQVQPQNLRDICNQSMGRDAAAQAVHNPARTKDTCFLAADPNDRANCITGAVKEFISNFHSMAQAEVFCGLLDDQNKAACAATANSYYRIF